jgi:hypothetical protein
MRKPIIVVALGSGVGAGLGAFLGLVLGVIISLVMAVVGWLACILSFSSADKCISFATEVFKNGAISLLVIGIISGLMTGTAFAAIVNYLNK